MLCYLSTRDSRSVLRLWYRRHALPPLRAIVRARCSCTLSFPAAGSEKQPDT